jgi:hypothetical protein
LKKIKLETIWESANALAELINIDIVRLKAYKLKKLIFEINDEMKIIQSLKNDLVKKYGVKNEKTGVIEVLPDNPNYENYLSDFIEILQQEIELKELSPNMLSINDIKSEKIKTNILMKLDWLIK